LGDSRSSFNMIGVYYKIGNYDKKYLGIDYFTQVAMIFNKNLLCNNNINDILKPLEEDLIKHSDASECL
jgi:hypothetical protein